MERKLAAACRSRADADTNLTKEKRSDFIKRCLEQRYSSSQIQEPVLYGPRPDPAAFESTDVLDTSSPASTITFNTYGKQ